MKKPLFLLLILGVTSPLFSAGPLIKKSDRAKTFFSDIYGKTPVDCVYTGMWTYHFQKRWRDRNDNWNNQAFGFQYKSVFLNTLVNSHYKRCYIFGITRDWLGFKPTKHTKFTFGYRLGLIHGYGAELNKWAEMYPLLPVYQICAQAQYRRARIEVSYFRALLSAYLTWVVGEY